MSEKPIVSLPIIVEGRYDKSTLCSMVEATVITTEGFGIFNNKEKQALLRRICKDGVIVMTDSDGGGRQIRGFLSSIIPRDKIYHIYTPEIEGKERRKDHRSKAGVLGVEGMKSDVILRLLSPFLGGSAPGKSGDLLTKVDFFRDKLTGYPNSSARREMLASRLDLPSDMTPNALLEAINLLVRREEYERLISEIFED